jgi:hypothetical protein
LKLDKRISKRKHIAVDNDILANPKGCCGRVKPPNWTVSAPIVPIEKIVGERQKTQMKLSQPETTVGDASAPYCSKKVKLCDWKLFDGV